MAHFMVVFQLRPETSMAEVRHLLPAEQARTTELKAQGILLEFHMVANAPKAFLLFQTETREQLQQILEQYPLYPHATWDINPVAEPAP